jgi:AcrR family transcriptional regulator
MSTNASTAIDPGTDLRTRRTRRHLRDALVELIAEQGYEAVTVVDVCERAMVHRTTFYKHYAGKPELLGNVLDERLAELMAALATHTEADPAALDADDGVRLMRRMVRSVHADHAFYAIIARRDAASLVPRLTDSLRRRLLDTPVGAAATRTHAPRAELRAHLHAALIVNAIIWWLNNDTRLAPDDLAAVLAEELTGRR